MSKHTPGPWFVRTRVVDGEVVDCFVAAKDTQGLPYDAEILGDDEYRDGIERKLADAHMAAAAPDLLEALQGILAAVDETDCWLLEELNAARTAISAARGELFNAGSNGPSGVAAKVRVD